MYVYNREVMRPAEEPILPGLTFKALTSKRHQKSQMDLLVTVRKFDRNINVSTPET